MKERAKVHEISSEIEDYISQMPDELLQHMLSFLNVKDAARTTVLSRRWRYLVACRVNLKIQVGGNQKGVSMANHVVALHRDSTIDAFGVSFINWSPKYSHDMESWIRFAIQKSVQELHLYVNVHKSTPRCAFPELQPGDFPKIRFLTCLCLEDININEKTIECFLMECKFLERLVIVRSETLVDLKVVGPQQLKLKYLYILNCHALRSIAIHAQTPDLVSLGFKGRSILLHIEKAPNVTGLRYASRGYGPSNLFTQPIRRYLPQLQTLHYDTRGTTSWFTNCPEFLNLKHLVMTIDGDYSWGLPDMIHLLKAAPILHKLTLQIGSIRQMEFNFAKKQWPATRSNGAPSHQRLQVLEIINFEGKISCIKLILYLLKNLLTLNKLVIDPHIYETVPLEKMEGCEEKEIQWPQRRYPSSLHLYKEAIKSALKLKTKLPPGVDFVLVE